MQSSFAFKNELNSFIFVAGRSREWDGSVDD